MKETGIKTYTMEITELQKLEAGINEKQPVTGLKVPTSTYDFKIT